jgi:hypothetical protein
LPALLNAHQIAKMGVHQFEAIQKLVGWIGANDNWTTSIQNDPVFLIMLRNPRIFHYARASNKFHIINFPIDRPAFLPYNLVEGESGIWDWI